MADHITNFRCEEIVIRGDFNLTLNVVLDKVGGRKTNHTRSLAVGDWDEHGGGVNVFRRAPSLWSFFKSLNEEL